MEVAGPAEITQGLHSNTAARITEAGTVPKAYGSGGRTWRLLKGLIKGKKCPDGTKMS